MSWAWEPGLRCGPFVFGEALPETSEALSIEDLGWGADGTGWDSFNVQGGAFTVHVEAGLVVAVESWERLDYQGANLVGLEARELEQLFGMQLVAGSDLGEAQGYEVEVLGLALWLEGGRVTSVSVNRIL